MGIFFVAAACAQKAPINSKPGRSLGAASRASLIQIASPAAASPVSGNMHLSLSGDLSGVASVEYLIGDYRLARVTQKPFTLDWNSALAADGNVQIEAIARDAFGAILSDTGIPVVFSNYGNRAELVNGPLPATLSGTVPLVIHAFDSKHYPAYWQTFIDGELVSARYTDQNGVNDVTLSESIDTTAYTNGRHELYVVFHSNDFNNPNPPPGPVDFRGMIVQNVDIENGRTFMDVVGNYLHVYVPVTTGSVSLGCMRAYTNGDRDACLSPKFAPDDNTVVSVDAAGNLAGLKEGYTNVTITEGSRSTQVRVWVKSDLGLPHFTTNGNYSTTYTPGQSTFIVAPFLLAPSYVSASANLMAEVRRAGINALTRGIYINPIDLNTTYAAWKQSFDALVLPDLQFTAANGFRMIGSGDDIARNIGTEAFRSLNWPPAKQAIQYAMQQFAQSGAAVSAEMIDEGAFLWGPNPAPPGKLGAPNSMQSITCAGAKCTVAWPSLTDVSYHDAISNGLTFTITGNPQLNNPPGTYYTVQNATANSFDFVPAQPMTATFTAATAPNTEYEWFARAGTCSGAPCNPPVLNSALSTITSWVKSGPAFPAISFPAGGIVLPPAQRNWIGQGSLSDYASHYWDTGQLRPTYIFGKGIRETNYYMLSSFYSRQQYMQLYRPQTMLISISGTSFIKNSPAGTPVFSPPVDQFQYAGMLPKTVASSMFSAVAAGISGLRLYQFETPDNYQQQVNAGPGSSYQSGAAPTYGEVKLWRAMGYAANLLTNVLQPYILGMPVNSPSYGRNIVTGARKAAAGNLLIVVNGWDGPSQVNVDFRPYMLGYGCVRYRVNDTYIRNSIFSASTGENIQLASGETVIYVFPSAPGYGGIDLVNFLPLASPGLSRVALTYGYVYDQDVPAYGETVDCSSGCTVPVDRRIANIYLQYSLVNSATGAVSPGSVGEIGAEDSIQIPNPAAWGGERSPSGGRSRLIQK